MVETWECPSMQGKQLGSKKNARPRDIRSSILSEALRLFAENGFEGTSVQTIADAVGIKKPSLLYHFSSKDDLREAVIAKLLNHWTRELPRLLAKVTSQYEGFAATIKSLAQYFTKDTNRARLAVREMLDRPAEIRDLIQQHLHHWIQLLANHIRLGQQSGVFKSEVNPEAYIMQIIIMVIGTVAFSTVASAFGPQSNDVLQSRIHELVRIAREALFVDSGNKKSQ